MRSLEASLDNHPLAMLRGIAELRGVALATNSRAEAAAQLAAIMAEPEATEMIVAGCSPTANAAWVALREAGGRMKLPAFARSFGPLRPIGPGRLEREAIWRQPQNAAEELWFRGLIFRAFTDLGDGLIEYVYIPDELMPPKGASFPDGIGARRSLPAAARDPSHPRQALNSLAVDACWVLASLRAAPARLDAEGRLATRDDARLREGLLIQDATRLDLLVALALQRGWLVRERGRLTCDPRNPMAWLGSTHWEQMSALFHAWRDSADRPPAVTGWNDLRHTPGLQPEGGWRNDPLLARNAVLDALQSLEAKTWYAAADFVALIKALDPDFQRPDGDYHSWYLRDAATSRYLSGFESWDDVEGRLIRFLIAGPLFWLGAVALGPPGDGQPGVLRLTSAGECWLSGTVPAELPRPARLVVHDDFTISAPLRTPLNDRFRLLRFTEPAMANYRLGQPTRHRITRGSLAGARAAGLSAAGIQQYLRRASGSPLPARVAAGLTRWGQHTGSVRISRGAVLRVEDADTLAKLRSDPAVIPLLGDLISAQAILVSQANLPKLLAILDQLGYAAKVE
jgi:Helicase conserved C-terminal domain